MRYTKQPGRLGQYWLTRRPGRAGWYITWLDPKTRQTRRKTAGTTDLAEAQKKLAELFTLEERLDREKLADVPLVTLLDRYYQEHARKLPSGQQVRFAIRQLRHYFNDSTLADFRKKDQEKFADALRLKGLSDSYISRIFSVAKAAIRRAYDNEEIDRVPPMLHFAKSETRDRVLSLEEAAALFNAAESDSQWMYLLLAFCTGARPTAILDLTTDQIDCEARLIQLNPHGRKQNKKRRPVVAIPEVLLPCLKAIPPGPVVNYGGRPYTPLGWRNIFRNLAKRAALPDVTLYVIRHTVATELRKRGVAVWEVAGFLGHSMPRNDITERYAKFLPNYQAAVVQAVDAYFADLAGLVHRPFFDLKLEEQPTPLEIENAVLRAHCVPISTKRAGLFASNVLNYLVGVTGFEPATYTSRKLHRLVSGYIEVHRGTP